MIPSGGPVSAAFSAPVASSERPRLQELGEARRSSAVQLPRSSFQHRAQGRSSPLSERSRPSQSEPGVGLHLFRGDRGSRKGQYAVVVVDTLKRRQQGSSAQEPFVKNGAEYHLVAPETVGALPEVDVLGLHYTKRKADRVEAFERFVREKLHPSVANLRPDLKILPYRSARREDAGSYLAFALTRASRDKSLARRIRFRCPAGRVQARPGADEGAQYHISCGELVPRGPEVCCSRVRKPPVGGSRAGADGSSLADADRVRSSPTTRGWMVVMS